MASLLTRKEEIHSAVKKTLKEELSRDLSEHKNTVEEQTNDSKAGTCKRTKSIEEFYTERKANRQGRERGKILHQLLQQQQIHQNFSNRVCTEKTGFSGILLSGLDESQKSSELSLN